MAGYPSSSASVVAGSVAPNKGRVTVGIYPVAMALCDAMINCCTGRPSRSGLDRAMYSGPVWPMHVVSVAIWVSLCYVY